MARNSGRGTIIAGWRAKWNQMEKERKERNESYRLPHELHTPLRLREMNPIIAIIMWSIMIAVILIIAIGSCALG